MEEPGTLTLNLASAQSHLPGTVLHVSPALEEESTTMSPINASAQADKPSTDLFVPSTAQLGNSTMKLSEGVFVLPVKTGTETFVFSASVDKHGILLSTLVFAQVDQSGMDTLALTHVQEEEFWMP